MNFDINVLLDRSGSMESRKEDHIGGLRSFINDQKNQEGKTDFTLIQFDSDNAFEKVFDGVDINTVDTSLVDLIPRGGTPLLDAVGKTIAHIESRLKDKDNTQVVLMIITDGGENSSREWSRDKVQKAVKDKENDWKILYLGANVDAFGEAYNLGINAGSAMNFANTAVGTTGAYMANCGKLGAMRSAYTSGLSKSAALDAGNYNDEDRALCADGDAKLTTTDNTSVNVTNPNWTS